MSGSSTQLTPPIRYCVPLRLISGQWEGICLPQTTTLHRLVHQSAGLGSLSLKWLPMSKISAAAEPAWLGEPVEVWYSIAMAQLSELGRDGIEWPCPDP